MSAIIDQFVTSVDQAIRETAREYDDGIPYDQAAEAPRSETVNRACDLLLEQAAIIMDDTRYLPNGDLVRHICHLQVADGAAYAMITWNADRLHLWPDGKPATDWRKGCIVWSHRGQAGRTLFDRIRQVIETAAAGR